MTATTRLLTRPASHIVRQQRPATTRDTWENRAACYNRPENWFDGEDPDLTQKARATCLSCPVLAECLNEQMRLEAAQMWTRDSIRGGLTGSERVQLCIDEQADGPYDAEEARLLALEAGASDKPVAEIAEDGLSASTLRLAARLAGEKVPVRDATQVKEGTKLWEAYQHATTIMRWRDGGVSRDEICSRLGIGRATVDSVIRVYRDLNCALSTSQVNIDDSEKTLINDYLMGKRVLLSVEQQIAAIVEGLKQGLKYPDIDHAQRYSRGTTAQFVSRQRKKYRAEGRPFPITTDLARRLTFTEKQVREIRELAATGKYTDLELAMRYGVVRNVISHLVSGRNYRKAGGPIREGKSAAATQASKRWNDKFCTEAFSSGQRLEKAG